MSLNGELKHGKSGGIQAENELAERNRLLSTLLDVSNLVSSTMDMKLLLEAVLDKLKSIIDYKDAKIFKVAGSKAVLFAHRSVLTGEEERNYIIPFESSYLSRYFLDDRKPLVIPDIYADSPEAVSFREVMNRYLATVFKNVRSWIGFPMVMKDRVIGILTLDSDKPGFYGPRHIEPGMAFANQAAIEFHNATLYNEITKKADELKTMFTIQQAITSRLDLDTVLKLIADESRRLTGSYSTAVFLVDGDDLIFSVFSGGDHTELIGYRTPIEKTFMGRNLLRGESVILTDTATQEGMDFELVSKAGVRSYLCVPLLAGSRPVGIISATNKLKGEFDSEDERILNMFAPCAVIGIENARMYQDERKRHQEDEQRRHVAEGLRDILAILNTNKTLDEILDFIVKEAARLMGTDSGALYRLQKDMDVLVMKAACGLPDEFLEETAIPVGTGAIGRSVKSLAPVVTADIPGLVESLKDKNGLHSQTIWLEEHCSGLLAVPLFYKEDVYGGIALYFKKEQGPGKKARSFSKDEIDLAMTFADQAALAIDNARLRTQAEEIAVEAERNRIARDLHDAVTQTLFSASLIAEVLPRIWERNPEEGKNRLSELRQLTRGALAEMRTLLLELRPVTLMEAPIADLLKQLAEAITGRARIPVTLNIDRNTDLPVEVKVAFYRIAQEALNNIARHSDASRAAMSLVNEEDSAAGIKKVELKISDDGKGFDPGTITADHYGVGIMRERADTIGAGLIIDGKPGFGTDIVLQWECRI